MSLTHLETLSLASGGLIFRLYAIYESLFGFDFGQAAANFRSFSSESNS